MKFFNALIGATPRDLTTIAVACEAAGFDGVALSDHVVYPEDLQSDYPYTPDGKPMFSPETDWPDPWVLVGALGAVTTTLEFVTNVYVLPLRNPFVTAKAVGTAAYLTDNRVRLGIGAGWMREEFELMGQPFEQRGARLDETIEILRALWGGGMVEYHGKHFDFDRVEMRPAPTEPVPIYVGGHSKVALRRAARNDGWVGVNYGLDELETYCIELQRVREEQGTADRPFEIVASPLAVPDAETVVRLEDMGVTTLLTSAWMAAGHLEVSRDQAVDLIGTYGEKYIAPLRG